MGPQAVRCGKMTEPYSQAAVAEKVARLLEIMRESAGIIHTEDGLTQSWEFLLIMRIEVERIHRGRSFPTSRWDFRTW